MRVQRWFYLPLFLFSSTLLAQTGAWSPPQYNFSSYEVLIRTDLLQTGATFVFYDEDPSGLNGFYSPTCIVTLDGSRRMLRNTIAINLDLVLSQGLSPSRVLAHELTHYKQRLRSGSLQAYLREWHRQQQLPYELRPWEQEAHQAELRAPELVRIVGRRATRAASIVFDNSVRGTKGTIRGRMSSRD